MKSRPAAGRQFLVFITVSTIVFAGCAGSDGSAGPSPSEMPTASRVRPEGRRLETLAPLYLYPPDAGDHMGAVAAGDFNGDGLIDLAAAAAFADGPGNSRQDSGEVYVFLGPFEPGESFDTSQTGRTAGRARDAAAGTWVSGVSGLNLTPRGGEQALIVYGAAAGDQAGRALAVADLDGDAFADLIIGSPMSDGPSGNRQDAGRVDVLYGDALGLASSFDLAAVRPVWEDAAFTVYGASAGDLAGLSLATGRLSDDRRASLVLSAIQGAGPAEDRPLAGEVYVLHGSSERRTGALDLALPQGRADVTLYGAVPEGRLGEALATADVDGDGREDLIVPAPFEANPSGAAGAGRTYVLLSPLEARIEVSATAAYGVVHGVDEGDQLGHFLAAGDADGDGRADLLLTAVSADGIDNSSALAGEAALLLNSRLAGDVDVAAGGADSVIYGEDEKDRLGRSAAFGDLDGDGRDELLLGAPGGAGEDESSGSAGEIHVLRLDAIEAEHQLPEESFVYYGADSGDTLASEIYGRSPLIAADLNGDGRDELIAAAPLADGPRNEREDCGEVVILFITGDFSH